MDIYIRPLKIKLEKIDTETKLLYLWFFNLFSLTMIRFFLFSGLGVGEGIARTVILYLAAAIPFVAYLIYVPKMGMKKVVPFFAVFAFVVITWLISELTNPALWEFLNRENYGPERFFRPDAALFALPFFMMFDNPKRLLKNVTVYAYMYFVYEMIFGFIPAMFRGYWTNVSPTGEELRLTYSLSFGYAMCFPTVVFLYRSIKERKIIHMFLAAASLWCIITNGNRGALLIPMIFIILIMISKVVEKQSVYKKVSKIFFVITASFTVYILREELMRIAVWLIGKTGLSSRNITMLLQGNIANDNGRELIWRTVIEAIREGGIFGYGIYGDRPFVSPIHYVGYSHNLFLELIVSFGIVGVIIIFVIVFHGIYMIFFCKDTDWRELYIIFFSISCQLLLSLSFWYVWEFWAAVAIACRYRQLSRGKAGC